MVKMCTRENIPQNILIEAEFNGLDHEIHKSTLLSKVTRKFIAFLRETHEYFSIKDPKNVPGTYSYQAN